MVDVTTVERGPVGRATMRPFNWRKPGMRPIAMMLGAAFVLSLAACSDSPKGTTSQMADCCKTTSDLKAQIPKCCATESGECCKTSKADPSKKSDCCKKAEEISAKLPSCCKKQAAGEAQACCTKK